MTDVVYCPICGMGFDANYAEGEMEICPYCEKEAEHGND